MLTRHSGRVVYVTTRWHCKHIRPNKNLRLFQEHVTGTRHLQKIHIAIKYLKRQNKHLEASAIQMLEQDFLIRFVLGDH